MTTSHQNQPGFFGVAYGLLPNYGPKVMQYFLDLTNGPNTFDITNEIMKDKIEFIQSVSIDNSANATALVLTFAVTGFKIICPPYTIGIFTLLVPPGALQISASGPAAKFNLLFSNMPIAPSAVKVQ